MRRWQLQTAKARFSELVKEAVQNGPQGITLRGECVVVILSKEKYTELTKPKLNFIQLLQQSPLQGLKLNFKRNTSKTREVDL